MPPHPAPAPRSAHEDGLAADDRSRSGAAKRQAPKAGIGTTGDRARRDRMVIDLVLGLLLFAGGVVSLARQSIFARRAVPTTGVVVRCEPAHDALHVHPSVPHAIRRDRPVVRYQTGDGVELFASLPTVHQGRHATGERIPLHYDPRKPQRLVVRSLDYWLVPCVFLVLGAALIAAALLAR
jgi:hypothetical protein